MAHQDADQWPRPLAASRRGDRAPGHLHQGVMAALGRGAGQMAGGGGVAVFGPSRSPVGVEQIL
ncbi:MAG: hypothetical protein ACREF4_10830, partial [Gammaproteobacteria bacterium]